MKNSASFFRTPLDKLVEKLSLEERSQIMLDYDHFERTGTTGDTALRERAGDFYRQLQGRETGFDAMYMVFLGASVHKIASMQAIEASQSLETSDQTAQAMRLLSETATLPSTREIGIIGALALGETICQAEAMESAIDRFTQVNSADINAQKAKELDGIIREARIIVGLETPSIEEELAVFAAAAASRERDESPSI